MQQVHWTAKIAPRLFFTHKVCWCASKWSWEVIGKQNPNISNHCQSGRIGKALESNICSMQTFFKIFWRFCFFLIVRYSSEWIDPSIFLSWPKKHFLSEVFASRSDVGGGALTKETQQLFVLVPGAEPSSAPLREIHHRVLNLKGLDLHTAQYKSEYFLFAVIPCRRVQHPINQSNFREIHSRVSDQDFTLLVGYF